MTDCKHGNCHTANHIEVRDEGGVQDVRCRVVVICKDCKTQFFPVAIDDLGMVELKAFNAGTT